VVAYDGSHHAHGALKTAVTLANEWGSSLDIVTVGEERAQAILKEARSYIEPHKIQADYHVETGDTAEAIVTFAKEHKAEMLVLGTYSHSIVRDMLIGSTTAYVLTHAPCPLLLAP